MDQFAASNQLQFDLDWDNLTPLTDNEDKLFRSIDAMNHEDLFPSSPTRLGSTMDPFLSSSAVSIDDDLGQVIMDEANVANEPIVEGNNGHDDEVVYYNSDEDQDMYNADQQQEEEPTPPNNDHDYVPVKKTGKRKALKTRRGLKKRKPKANAWSVKMNKSQVKRNEDTLLYQQKPFQDNPELERCRKNALSAKLNREKKKKEQEKIAAELNKLKKENERLKKQGEVMKNRANSAEFTLNRIRAVLAQNHREDLLKLVVCGVRHDGDRDKRKCNVCSLGNKA